MIDTARFSASAAAEGFELTARQLEQFDQYAQFLVEYNEKEPHCHYRPGGH